MKFNSILFRLIIIIACLLVFYSCFEKIERTESRSKSHAKSKTKYWIRPLIKTAKSYMSFANLAYCNLDVINSLACPLCSSILDNSFKLMDLHAVTYNDHPYRFVILASESHREVVLTFAGPKSSDGLFYGNIYQSGFGKFKGQNIEKAFLDVYTQEIQIQLNNLPLR